MQAGIHVLSCRCQGQRSHATVEQLQAEQILKRPDLMAESTRRHVQLLRRFRHAQMPCRRLEGAQAIQGWCRVVHEKFSIIE